MFKQTALITWKPEVDPDERASIIKHAEAMVAADLSYRGKGLKPPSWRGGDLVWHLHFADEASWAASGAGAALDFLAQDAGTANLDAAAYPVNRHLARSPSLTDGIYRTLFVCVEPYTTREQWREFVADTEQMPDYVPEIANWALNETVASRGEKRWTHVWEQEYAQLGDLTGPYLQSPYHLFHVDRWFDPEMSCCIIEPAGIRHSASELRTSVIALY